MCKCSNEQYFIASAFAAVTVEIKTMQHPEPQPSDPRPDRTTAPAPKGWKMSLADITPARVGNDAAFIRCLKSGVSKRESEAAARRMLELAVELQRPLHGPEFNECIRQAVEACATESVTELDPEHVVEYEEQAEWD